VSDYPTTPDTLSAVLAELKAIRDLLADLRAAADPSLLVGHEEGQRLLGVSRSGWFRMAATPGFPRSIDLGEAGIGPRYRRADLEAYVARLKTKRRSPKAVEVTD
jgi:predicted DNA-binding transcriptional regulator AlpA